MKKQILLTFLLLGICQVSFSQASKSPKGENINKNLTPCDTTPSKYFSLDSLKKGHSGEIEVHFDLESTYTLLENEYLHNMNSMPIYKPEGAYSIPYAKPDSTINYTLLKKDIQVIKPNKK